MFGTLRFWGGDREESQADDVGGEKWWPLPWVESGHQSRWV